MARRRRHHKYINPSTVHKKKKRHIKKKDRRNSEHAKDLLDEDFIIDEEDDTVSVEAPPTSDDLFSETVDPETISLEVNFEPVVPEPVETMSAITDFNLGAPENLSIDANSYQIEDVNAASDGIIRFVASLYFDDVSGAADYEYLINAKS